MNRSNALITTLVSGLAVSLPDPAISDDIPFFVTNNASSPECLFVSGPWGRSNAAGENLFPAFLPRTQFYSAETTAFSPFGTWTIQSSRADGEGRCAVLVNVVEFCLDEHPDDEVDITITPDGTSTVNFTPPPCNDFVQATAFLGHVPGQSPMAARGRGHRADRDRDAFRFEGDAGDAVIVSLEPEGTKGAAGEHARLVLRDSRGGTLSEETAGPLPLEIAAVLPGPGSYEVVVEEQPRSSNPFRGHYQLTLQSSAEVDLSLDPLPSVEP